MVPELKVIIDVRGVQVHIQIKYPTILNFTVTSLA